jgi:hypothetical protein
LPKVHFRILAWVRPMSSERGARIGLGAGAAAVVALIALAIDRWPEATYSN